MMAVHLFAKVCCMSRSVLMAFLLTASVLWCCVWISGCWLTGGPPSAVDPELLAEPEAREYLCTLAVLSENEHAIELCEVNARIQAIAETMAGCREPH